MRYFPLSGITWGIFDFLNYKYSNINDTKMRKNMKWIINGATSGAIA